MIIRTTTTPAPTTGSVPVATPLVVSSGPGAGLQPKAGVFEATGATTLGTISTNSERYTAGITDGTTQRSIGVLFEDVALAANADAGTRNDTDSVIDLTIVGNESREGEASWSSWANGGANLNVNDLFATAVQLRGTYFFGDDIEVSVVEFTHTGALDAEQSVTGLAFAPNFVHAICFGETGAAFAADSSGANLAHSIGYAVKTLAGSIQQWAYGSHARDRTTPTRVRSRFVSDAIAAPCANDLTDPFQTRLELTAWTSDGATFTKRGSVATNVTVALLFICFKGSRPLSAFVERITMTTAGNVSITTPGFAPQAYFALGSMMFTTGAGVTTDLSAGRASHGVYTGTESAHCSFSGASGQSATVNECVTGVDLVWRVIENGATAFSGAHASIDPTGFTVAIDGNNLAGYDEDGGKLVGFVAIGSVDSHWPKRRSVWSLHHVRR